MLTPARLKYGHKLTSQLEFHLLFRALLLRLSLLVLCHRSSGMLLLPAGRTVPPLAVAQYFYRDRGIDAAARRSIHEAIAGAPERGGRACSQTTTQSTEPSPLGE
jgi:hypothetical protein